MLRRTGVCLALVLILAGAGAASAGFSIRDAVVSSGGSATGVVGQPCVDRASSGRYSIGSGVVPPDESIPISTGIEDGPIGPQLRLAQNHPNPFNPRTVIRYELPAEGRVSLRVYNLAGRVVRTLVDGRQSAGRQSIVWSGHDDRGQSVASGTYVYALETPGGRLTRKLSLVR